MEEVGISYIHVAFLKYLLDDIISISVKIGVISKVSLMARYRRFCKVESTPNILCFPLDFFLKNFTANMIVWLMVFND